MLKINRNQFQSILDSTTHILKANASPKLELIPKQIIQHRTIFSGPSSSRTMVYRRLGKLEQEANLAPQDIAKQAILYKVLFDFLFVKQFSSHIFLNKKGVVKNE